jgi:hypothetical protein
LPLESMAFRQLRMVEILSRIAAHPLSRTDSESQVDIRPNFWEDFGSGNILGPSGLPPLRGVHEPVRGALFCHRPNFETCINFSITWRPSVCASCALANDSIEDCTGVPLCRMSQRYRPAWIVQARTTSSYGGAIWSVIPHNMARHGGDLTRFAPNLRTEHRPLPVAPLAGGTVPARGR